MQQTYVHINFTPGCAGNFLSRSLNLIDQAYCWTDPASVTVPETVDEKLALLSYSNVADRKIDTIEEYNWLNWERELVSFNSHKPHNELPPGSMSIWAKHHLIDPEEDKLAGDDDQEVFLMIDYKTAQLQDWAVMNAFYKNTRLDYRWYEMAEKFRKNPEWKKINLEDFFTWEKFSVCYIEVCNTIGVSDTRIHLTAVKILWQQWRSTILEFEDISKFKQSMGWLL